MALLFLSILLTSGTIDLANLLNYSNQPVPSYVNPGLSTVPTSNTMDDKIATLGRVLFYNKKLSSNNQVSCASCHAQANAFGLLSLQGPGVNGMSLRRPMRLVNLRFRESFEGLFWDERAADLETLSTQPIQDHIEMGYSGANGDPNFNALITKLNNVNYYDDLFHFAYGSTIITEEKISKALSQFVRSIQSYDSKFDVGLAGAGGNHLASFSNFTTAENAGKTLFNTDAVKNSSGQRTGGGLGCFHCHDPKFLHFIAEQKNNGVITEISGSQVLNITKAPSLRDIFDPSGNLNGPLFHNGQATTFGQLLDHYNNVPSNANIDSRIAANGIPLNLTTTERNRITAFMKTLTGSDIYTNPKWSDPFDASGNITILGSSLPIILSKFYLTNTTNKIQLFWETASEQNTSHFLIEHSIDGINFTTLNSVTAVGNSSVVTKYQYTDANPKSGVNYYRLKQVDIDGKYNYSNTISSKLQEIYTTISVLHNNLIVKTADIGNTIYIYNATGQLLNKYEMRNTREFNVNIGNLNRGIVIVKVKGKTILIIGGAGGVGSIAIQLAKKIANLKVITTASRPETIAWCKAQGADVVVNHKNLVEEVRTAGYQHVDFIVDFVDTNAYWDAMVELIKPQGHIASITGSAEPIALNKLKTKSASFSWEFMYTRSMFETDDMIEQHHTLNQLADLLDKGILKSTLNTTLQGFTVENFKEAHTLLESGKTIGKIAIIF